MENENTFSPNAIAEIMQRVSSSGEEDSKELRRRGCNVTVFPEQCLPGYLTEPIKIGLVELSSSEEIRAYRSCGGITVPAGEETGDGKEESSVSQQALAVAFGKESLRFVNGRRLTSDERRVIWEVLGMTGRIVLGMAYMTHCTGATGGFLERSLASAEIL